MNKSRKHNRKNLFNSYSKLNECRLHMCLKPLSLSLGHVPDLVGLFLRCRYRCWCHCCHCYLDWRSNLCSSCRCWQMPLILRLGVVEMWPLGSWLLRDSVARIWELDIVRLPFVLSGGSRGLDLWLRIGVWLRELLASSRVCQRDGAKGRGRWY